jgi:tetratricopeptide (TPR) repeat protein
VRRLILALLFLGYAAVFVRLPSVGRAAAPFDPLDRRGREVERAIEERRFAEALPIALDLRHAHDADPVIAHWLAEIYRGLGRSADESQSWERVLALTRLADAACPDLPESYARAGDRVRALDAYERCAAAAPDDPERWFDLGVAYTSESRPLDAANAYAKSRALDPSNPRLPAGTSAWSDGAGEATR